jgi:uncharacterized repeat protein (TIGR01451 family)
MNHSVSKQSLMMLLIAVIYMSGCQENRYRYNEPTKTEPAPSRHSWGPGYDTTGGKQTQKGNQVRNALAFPSGDNAWPVVLEKQGPSEVAVNQSFEYTIKAVNTTSYSVDDVVVSEQFPENFKFSSAKPAGDVQGNEATWSLGKLNAGETKTIVVTGQATKSGEITECATISFRPYVCLTTKVIQPALSLVKTATPEVLLCDPITLTFVVTNNGTGTAKDVKITDNLPNGLRTQDGKKSVTFNVGELKQGASKDFKVSCKAESTGEYKNQAHANGAGGLKASSSTTTTVVRQPVLAITKSGPKKMFLGRSVTYTINVTNKGDVAAKNTVITDTLPAGPKFVRASSGGTVAAGKVTWKIGTLGVNQSKEVSVTVEPSIAGTIKNAASAEAYCAKAVAANAQTVVKGIPAILLEVIDLEDPIEVGGNVTYVITVTNQGSAPGTNIRIACDLEDTMEYVSSSGATRGSASGRSITFAPLASLAPKAKASWRVIVKAKDEADVRFGVKLTSDQMKRPVDETESTNFYR